MQNHDWIELFRLIPEAQHNTLVLTTHSGVDLAIELVIRTELTYLVFRGRVCGQTDDGRVFFLPYHQIDFLQLNRTVKEAEIQELFGATADAPKSVVLAAPGSIPGSAVLSPPKSGFAGSMSPGSSPQVVPMSPQIPAAALRPQPPRPALTVPTSRAAPSQAGGNVPAAALVPPPGAGNGPQPIPRNSILERLRAQRNAILPPRPPAR
jgi:hypothetical protein